MPDPKHGIKSHKNRKNVSKTYFTIRYYENLILYYACAFKLHFVVWNALRLISILKITKKCFVVT